MMACKVGKQKAELIDFVNAQHKALLQQLERALAPLPLPLDNSKGNRSSEDCQQSGPNAPSALRTTQPHAQGDSDCFDCSEALEIFSIAPETLKQMAETRETEDTTPDTQASEGRETKSEVSQAVSDAPQRWSSPTSVASGRNLKDILMGSETDRGRHSDRLACVSPYVDGIVVFFVLLNSLVLVTEAQYEGEHKGMQLSLGHLSPEYSKQRVVFQVLDFVFDIFFILEFVFVMVLLRTCRRAPVETAGITFMVLVSLVEMGMILCDWLGEPISDNAFHIVHAVTCLRSLRCLKALQHFKGPQLLLSACNSFLHSLFWCVIFLGIFMFSSALCMANGLFSFYASEAASLGDKVFIWENYGTTFRAWYTLFELTFSGSWPLSTRLVIEKVHPSVVIFFVVYITIIAFGLIRVITAVFIRDTLDAAANDAAQQVAEQMKKKEEYARKLEEIFTAIDIGGEGLLTEDQLSEALHFPKIKAYFQTLDLDVHESKALFHILDDGDGTVTLSEFITGLLRCKGQARAIDQVAAHTEIKHLDRKMNQMLSLLESMNSTQSSDAETCESQPLVAITNSLAAFGENPPKANIRMTR